VLDASFLAEEFADALAYDAYLESGSPSETEAFDRVFEQAALTPEHRDLIASFTRETRVIVLSGMWCGDCVAQCPLIARIAEANPAKVLVRFADRDEHDELSTRAMINQGRRVPAAIFMAEDHEFVHLLGDRTLSRYRAVAGRQLGAACELPGASVSGDETAACLDDWVREFERVQLLLRLSPRLRQKHGD
jgi:thiol-disulfide isomerase/thioredoxin